jgi:hypothetical protein
MSAMSRRAPILSCLAAVALAALVACASSTTDDASAEDSNLTSQGEWGGQVSLRDRTTRDPDMPTPDGGWYVTPIHATLLPSGRIFVSGWSRAAKDSCTFPDGSRRNGASFVLDPAAVTVLAGAAPRTLAIAPLDERNPPTPPWRKVLYCAGHAPVVVGGETAILLTGGSRYLNLGEPSREVEEGLRTAHLAFGDRPAPSIELLDDMMKSGPICQKNDGQELAPGEAQARGGKWYATNTRMPDGTVLVTGGFTGGPTSTCVQNRHSASAEVFDPAARTFHALFQPEDLPDGVGERFAPGDKDYTHTVLLPEPVLHDGRSYDVAMMGYAGFVVFLSTTPGLAAKDRLYVPPNGSRPGDAMAWDSTMALVSTGELLVMGGTGDAGTATRIDLYDPKKDAWTSVDTKIGRRNAAATLLPDGKVLLVNGWRDDSASLGLDERTRPILFDPETRTFETLDGFSGDHERGYHSFSLLAKDGSIVVGGGIYPSTAMPNAPKETDIGCERTDVQAWKPPYLAGGGARPVIDASGELSLAIGGGAIRVAFHGAALDAKKGAVLMALGSFTHGFDQNQRYVRLALAIDGGDAVVTPPATASIAPPGDYMLFLVSDAGVPSVAKHVRVTR